MSSIEKIYEIGTTPQIIDINKSINNFNCDFEISCENLNDKFSLSIVSQLDLDSDKNIEYKNFTGSTKGNLNSTNNKYESYLMLVKSDNPVNITVKLKLDELPIVPKIETEVEDPIWNIKNLLLLIILIGVGLLIYFYFSNKSKKEESNNVYTSQNISSNIILSEKTNDKVFSPTQIIPSPKKIIPSPKKIMPSPKKQVKSKKSKKDKLISKLQNIQI